VQRHTATMESKAAHEGDVTGAATAPSEPRLLALARFAAGAGAEGVAGRGEVAGRTSGRGTLLRSLSRSVQAR